jgi:hypothetical protein
MHTLSMLWASSNTTTHSFSSSLDTWPEDITVQSYGRGQLTDTFTNMFHSQKLQYNSIVKASYEWHSQTAWLLRQKSCPTIGTLTIWETFGSIMYCRKRAEFYDKNKFNV